MSNYEFDTVTEWLDYWFNVRYSICLLADKCCACILKVLSGKALGNSATETDKLREEFSLILSKQRQYPKEDRPFEDKAKVPERLVEIKSNYFQYIQFFNNQFPGFMARDHKNQRLALINLAAVQNTLEDMQLYFTEVAVELGFQVRNSKLCIAEKQSLAQLIMYCAYYKEHSPNKFLNKYQIKDWYENQCKNEMDTAEESLSLLQGKFSVHFPKGIYTTKLLRCYPVVVDGLDLSLESILNEVLISCIPFADTSFDYLVIISSNKQGEINPSALQVPKQIYKKENVTSYENMFMPYPVDVTTQMLSCFTEKYSLPVRENNDPLPIGEIIQELWVYSKSRELLTDPDDSDYCTKELQDIQNNIKQMLRSLEGKIPLKDAEQLSDVAENVFNGETFNDESFNKLVEQFAKNNPSS